MLAAAVRPLVLAELARLLRAAEGDVVAVADVVVGELRGAEESRLTPERQAAALAELFDAGEAATLVGRVWRMLPRLP